MPVLNLVRISIGLGLFFALVATVLRETFHAVSRIWHAPSDRDAAIEGGALFLVVVLLTVCVMPFVVVILP